MVILTGAAGTIYDDGCELQTLAKFYGYVLRWHQSDMGTVTYDGSTQDVLAAPTIIYQYQVLV